MIDKDYPTPLILKELEYETFQYLRTRKELREEVIFQSFFQDINLFFQSISDKSKLNSNRLSFESGFDQLIDNKLYHIVVGFVLDGIETRTAPKKNKKSVSNYKFVSYSISIIDLVVEKKVIKRLHFDYAISNEQPGPRFHFQFPGEMSTYIDKKGVDCAKADADLSSWFEKPRIIFFPISFALLLEFIFNEFPSITTNKIKNDNNWLGIVKKNEEVLLKPYYQNCSDFFKSNHKPSNLFYRNFYYE
ncbi:MAG: hypothetical protein KKD86_04730 [Bacteroidetes bacterium]|nr:hypothetical protein [Bacteroidota bacterium]